MIFLIVVLLLEIFGEITAAPQGLGCVGMFGSFRMVRVALLDWTPVWRQIFAVVFGEEI